MDIRSIVNRLIDDIANGASISQILLKAQIVAFSIGDDMFSRLIKNEQQGYSSEDTMPDYRKVKTMVKATFVYPFNNIQQTVNVPCEAIEDEKIRDLMTYVYIRDPLVQVEAMYSNAESEMVTMQVPIFAYSTIKSLYNSDGYKVYSAKYCFPKESLLSIVENFKAQLLDLLLQFDKELDWNAELSDDKNKSMAKAIINNVYNVNAVVANMGSGNIETNDIMTDC